MATRVVILGGGFGGVYTALGLDRSGRADLQVTLIDRNNFFLFTPMLSEMASGTVDTRHVVNPIRRMFHSVEFMEAEVCSIDFAVQNVHIRLPTGDEDGVPYDHLVIALGSVTNFFNLPGVEEHALGMKTLGDGVDLRNRVIQRLEEADVADPGDHPALLTFIVSGGGLNGAEVCGDLNDFVREASASYRNIRQEDLRVMLVEAGPRLIPQLSSGLADFAVRTLRKRGVEIYANTPVQSATDDTVTLGGLGTIPCRNLIWTAGVAPTPVIEALGLPLHKGRIKTDGTMRVQGKSNVWALGDAAIIPNGKGDYYPQMAQHAMREGRVLAANVIRTIEGQRLRPFRYHTLGVMATVGHRAGVGQILAFRVSGFLAWIMWRSYYLFRLPRVEKRVRVVLDWTLDLIFPPDITQLKVDNSREVIESASASTRAAS